MAPRPRSTENKSFPPRWHWHHGAIYYMVPPGEEYRWDGKKKFQLGKTEAEAYRTWSSRLDRYSGSLDTIGQGLDRYLLEEVPKKAPPTQESNRAAIKNLRTIFGEMRNEHFKPTHAYKYRDMRVKEVSGPEGKTLVPAPTVANRELEVLSHYFTKAIEWGALERHPMIEGKFRKLSRPGRDRVVEEWEVEEALKLPTPKYGRSAIPMMQAYIRIKITAGRRRIEILRLKTSDLLPEGVRFTLAKQRHGKTKYKIVKWSAELRSAIDAAIAARPVGKRVSAARYRAPADISPWVFCKWDGTPYLNDDGTESDAFGSAWGRFLDALLARTKITERFWDSDLRSKAADDAKDERHAQELLDHSTIRTTRKHYRRKDGMVDPAR